MTHLKWIIAKRRLMIFIILNASFECRRIRQIVSSNTIELDNLLIWVTHTRIRTYWLRLGEHLMTFLKLLGAILPAVPWRVYDTP